MALACNVQESLLLYKRIFAGTSQNLLHALLLNLMENLPTDPEGAAGNPGVPSDEALAAYIRSKETNENLEKLARALGKESQSNDPDAQPQTGNPGQPHVPDLSFEKFEEKRRRAGDQ